MNRGRVSVDMKAALPHSETIQGVLLLACRRVHQPAEVLEEIAVSCAHLFCVILALVELDIARTAENDHIHGPKCHDQT